MTTASIAIKRLSHSNLKDIFCDMLVYVSRPAMHVVVASVRVYVHVLHP